MSPDMWVRDRQFETRKLQQFEKDYKNCETTKSRDMWRWIETQICRELGRDEKKRN